MKFTIDDITFEITDTAMPFMRSNIDQHFIGSSRAHPTYYAIRDGLYDFLIAYHQAGGDVKSKACYAGIRAVLDRIAAMA